MTGFPTGVQIGGKFEAVSTGPAPSKSSYTNGTIKVDIIKTGTLLKNYIRTALRI